MCGPSVLAYLSSDVRGTSHSVPRRAPVLDDGAAADRFVLCEAGSDRFLELVKGRGGPPNTPDEAHDLSATHHGEWLTELTTWARQPFGAQLTTYPTLS